MGCITTPKVSGFKGFTVMGLPRSGSTWVYTLSQEFVEHRWPQQFKPPARYHGYRKPEGVVAFATYRDPRDSLLSEAKTRMNRSGDGTLEQAFVNVFNRDVVTGKKYDIAQCFSDPRVSTLRYEDFFPNDLGPLTCLISGKLGIAIPDGLRLHLLEKYSIVNIKKAQEQPCPTATQFTITNDGQKGTWKESLTPAMLEHAKDYLIPAVKALGYEQDDSWVKEIV